MLKTTLCVLALCAAPLVAVAQHSGDALPSPTGSSQSLGDLVLTDGFSRATLPNAPVAGGFVTITNTGSADDRLIAANSDVAGHVEVHEMAMEGQVMRMRGLPEGLPIPAGETVTLKPGGYHLMLMDLRQPLTEGETVSVTLTFERAGTVEMPLVIGASNATAVAGQSAGQSGHDGMDHGAMDHGK